MKFAKFLVPAIATLLVPAAKVLAHDDVIEITEDTTLSEATSNSYVVSGSGVTLKIGTSMTLSGSITIKDGAKFTYSSSSYMPTFTGAGVVYGEGSSIVVNK